MSRRRNKKSRSLVTVIKDKVVNKIDDIKVIVYGETEADDYCYACKTLNEATILSENIKKTNKVCYIMVNGEIPSDLVANTTEVTVKPKTKYTYKKQCHCATEIIPQVILCDRWGIRDMLALNPDVLVPLASISSTVWDLGYRGKIYALPTEDFGILPRDVLVNSINDLIDMINDGKRIAIFCEGGHGRTGYIASILIGLLDEEIVDPIKYVREHYCKSTIESDEQIREIADVLGKPELNKNKASSHAYVSYGTTSYDYYSTPVSTATVYNSGYYGRSACEQTSYLSKRCAQCDYYSDVDQECRYDMSSKYPTAWACKYFLIKEGNSFLTKTCKECALYESTSVSPNGTGTTTGKCNKLEDGKGIMTTSLSLACDKLVPIVKEVIPDGVKTKDHNCYNCRWIELTNNYDSSGRCILDDASVSVYATCEEWDAKDTTIPEGKDFVDMTDEEVERMIADYEASKFAQYKEEKING